MRVTFAKISIMARETVTPYNQKEDKKAQVGRMFDGIAPYYDFLNRLLSLGIDRIWRKRAIAQLNPADHRRILDVATGTADVAIQTARQVPTVEHITGMDLSEAMLEIGRQKIKRQSLHDRIVLEQGDSENLPYPDNSYDAVTVAFGVRNFEHLERGLAEMFRVLQPGGKLVVLEFSRPTAFPFKQLFNFYFANILPLIGRLQSKDPRAYRYLYESVQAFPDGQQFADILKQTGFNTTQWIPLTLGVCTIYTGEKPS